MYISSFGVSGVEDIHPEIITITTIKKNRGQSRTNLSIFFYIIPHNKIILKLLTF